MAEIVLSGSGWGGGLALVANLSYEILDSADTFTVSAKVSMTLKKYYGLYATPPVYLRVYKDNALYKTIKTSTKVAFDGSKTTTFKLHEESFSLDRGHTYRFVLSYTGSLSNGVYLGIPEQSETLVVTAKPMPADPNFTVALSRVWKTGDVYECAATITSTVSAAVSPFEVSWELYKNDVRYKTAEHTLNTGNAVSSGITTDAPTEAAVTYYKFVCTVVQQGVVKTAQIEIEVALTDWQHPYVYLSVLDHAETRYKTDVRALADTRNKNFKYSYVLCKGRGLEGFEVYRGTDIVVEARLAGNGPDKNTYSVAELVFTELDAGQIYTLWVQVIDTLGYSSEITVTLCMDGDRQYLVCGFTKDDEVVDRTLFCATASNGYKPLRIVEAAVVTKDGTLKKINQTTW